MRLSRSDLVRLNNQPLVEAARAYASAGWPVLPLNPREKTPLTSHGLMDATTNLDWVDGWWAQTPDANIGLRTGLVFDALDIDSAAGATQVAKLAPGYRHDGPVSSTGKGWHLLFAVTGAPNGANLRPKVDFRGQNGYIVAAPSVHPSGHKYMWARGSLEEEFPIPPEWLVTMVTPATRVVPDDRAPLGDTMAGQLNDLDIVNEFTRLGIQLRAEGAKYRTACLWHIDDKPSLVIYPRTQSFYCFGCGAWGDALNLQKFEKTGYLR